MKRLFIILMSAISLTTVAQMPPSWYDSDMRDLEYPYSQYFSGYAEGQRMSSESIENATKRIKDAARTEAVSTIRVHVKNTTISQSLSTKIQTMEGTFRQSVREFSSATQTTVDIEIPGLQVEAWQNPQTGRISAFAYVKKSTLIRQLEKRITVALTKIETSIDQIDQLIANGQKMQARELAQKTVSQFAETDEAQKLLAAVDENADEESLQLAETKQLSQRYTRMAADLRNGINIYFTCTAKLFSANFPTLKAEIQGELSKLGVSFVSNAAQADWIVTVNAAAREYNSMAFGSTTTYFAYVDINIAIEKKATGQRIYENEISEKGGHTKNFDYAAREAYKTLTPQVSAIIKEHIQQ